MVRVSCLEAAQVDLEVLSIGGVQLDERLVLQHVAKHGGLDGQNLHLQQMSR